LTDGSWFFTTTIDSFHLYPSIESFLTLRSLIMPAHTDSESAAAATTYLTDIYLAMQKEVALLQSSRISTNNELVDLRLNQDRVVREAESQIKLLRRQIKDMRNQFEEMAESNRMLLQRIQNIEANIAPSGSGASSVPSHDSQPTSCSRSRFRHLELRRQGAFQGDLNNICWEELNDVRGFNPDSPRYYWSATSPDDSCAGRKRTRGAAEGAASAPSHEQERCDEEDLFLENDSSPRKRRRVSSGTRIPHRLTPPAAARRSSHSAISKNRTTPRSTSFLADVIAGVSSVFLS